jgi:hypothetical protein
VDALCDGLPQEFGVFLREARSLEFTERPDYALYRTLFRELMLREGIVYDYQYDWLMGGRAATSPFVEAVQTPMRGIGPQVAVPLAPAIKAPSIREPRAAAKGPTGKQLVAQSQFARFARVAKR